MKKHLAAAALSVALACPIMATTAPSAHAVTVTGHWGNLPENRANWSCSATNTQTQDYNGPLWPGGQVQFYSQNCIIHNYPYFQSALIVRRGAGYTGRNQLFDGWSELVWDGANKSRAECSQDNITENEVTVCFSPTKTLTGPHIFEAHGRAYAKVENIVVGPDGKQTGTRWDRADILADPNGVEWYARAPY